MVMTERLAGGMDDLKENVKQVGKSSNMLQRFGNAIGALNLHQLTNIRGALEGIAERAGALGPSAQDTAAESFGAQYAASFRAATAGMGDMTAQMNRYRGAIGGVAYDLGVDAGEMVQGIRRIVQSGDELSDYGLTVRGVAGSMQAGILSAEQLGSTLTSLAHGYDLGTDGAQRVLDTLTALGEGIGAGSEFARALPNITEAADGIISAFPPGAAPGIDEVTESIARLAKASVDRLGGDANAAMQDAIATFTALGGQRRQIRDLVSGVASDFPHLAQEIGIASGDIDGALQSVMSDPITFAANMQQLMSQLDASDPRAMRLMASLEELPTSFRFLVTGGDDAAAALQRAQAPVENITGAFNRMGRSAAASGRTFGENMERMRDSFETHLNRMTTLSNSEVLGRQRRAFQTLENTIEGLRAEDGPVGGLTQAFLDFRRHGIIGLVESIKTRLLPSLGIQLPEAIEKNLPLIGMFGAGLFEGATEAGPLILAMTQMAAMMPGLGGAIGFLLNPWTLLVGGIAAAIYYWDDLLPLIENAGVYLEDLAGKVGDWVDSVDWQAVGESIKDGLVTIFASFGEGGRGREILRSVAGAIRSIFTNLGTMMSGITEGMFGETGGGIFNSIFGFLWDSTNLGNLQRAIEDGDWGDVLFEGFFSVFNLALMGLPGRVRTLFTNIFGADLIGGFWEDVVQPTFNDFVDYWDTEINPIIDEAILLWQDLASMALAFWEETVSPMLKDLKKEVVEVFVKHIWPAAKWVWQKIGVAAKWMWSNVIRPVIVRLAHTWVNTMSTALTVAVRTFGHIATTAVTAFNTIETAIGMLVIRWIGWRNTLSAGWELIGTTIRNSVGMAIAFADFHFTNLFEGMEGGMMRIERGFRNLPLLILDFIQNLQPLRGVLSRIGVDLGPIDRNLNEMRTRIQEPITELDEQLDEMERKSRARGEAYRIETARMTREIAQQATATANAYNTMESQASAYQHNQAVSLESTVSGIREFAVSTEAFFDRATSRLRQFVSDVESGRLAGRARQERVQEAYQSARPLLEGIAQAAQEGRIGEEQFSAAVSDIEQAVSAGRGFTSSEIERTLAGIGVGPGGGEAADERPTVTSDGRPRVDGRAATTGETPPAQRDRERRQAQREAQQTEREAERDMMIKAFGSEAMRQLRSVMGGDRNPTPRGASPRVAGPGPDHETR